MDKPAEAYVGPLTYDILWDQASLDNHSVAAKLEMVGATEPYQTNIHISPDMDENVQKITLAHELLHALWFNAGLAQILDPTQEQVVSLLAPRLLEFLQQNPHITGYLE